VQPGEDVEHPPVDPPVDRPEDPSAVGAPDTQAERAAGEGGAHRRSFHTAGEAIAWAAADAEMLTGHRETTEAEARAGVIRRVLRAFGGFLLIGVGIALLPLPGPGWVIIIIGLAMLPFAWAERTIVQIRRRIPGIPEEGAVPLSTWIIMGLMVAVFTTLSILFGKQLGNWIEGLWNDLWS
jgi:hypothetical protein